MGLRPVITGKAARRDANDALPVPLQAEQQQKTSDDQPQGADRDRGEGNAPDRDDDRQHHQAGRGAHEGVAVTPRRPDSDDDRDHFDCLDHSSEEGRQQDDAGACHGLGLTGASLVSPSRAALTSRRPFP